jgi:hypothetical protein
VLFFPVISFLLAFPPISHTPLAKGYHLDVIFSMIQRAMSAGAKAPGRATQAGKVKDEGRS